jgi:hypothetical protein
MSADVVTIRRPQRPSADAKTVTVDRELLGGLVALLAALIEEQPFEFGTHADMLLRTNSRLALSLYSLLCQEEP